MSDVKPKRYGKYALQIILVSFYDVHTS